MMCQPSGPESQSDKFLGIAASKHSSTDQQFFNLPFNDWAIVNCAWARQVGSLPLTETQTQTTVDQTKTTRPGRLLISYCL